jgi:prolyl-tRNA synthetase
MKMSKLIGRRYKERPAEATLESHAFLLRGAYIRQLANGIYSLLPPARRIVRKIEQIIREEMDKIDGQEVLMPVVLTRELWEESGRYESVGNELLRFKDRNDRDMILGMTHEEAALHISRNEVSSYKQFPFMIYQIQTKFRDEKRPRGGLIRVREFTMKDAYSFHTNQKDLDEYYEKVANAYKRIFERAGLPEVVMIKSDTGMMGGSVAHEFMLLTPSGEDTIVACDNCDYLANSEVAISKIESYKEEELPLEKIKTPSCKTIEEVSNFLEIPLYKNAKVVFYEKDSEGKPVMALIRGDLEINESKLSKIIKAQPEMASDETIRKIGAVPGFASPLGLDREKYTLIVDNSILDNTNLVCGANEEDTHYKNFNVKRDCPNTETYDIAKVKDGDTCVHCGGKIVLKRGIEVGNIFQLGTTQTTN